MKIMVRKGYAMLMMIMGMFAGASAHSELPNWISGKSTKEASAVDERDISVFTNWMKDNSLPPLEYLISKCNKHQVVILGEMHEIRDNLLFLIDAIPVLYERGKVTCIGLGVCNSEDNAKIERLVTAPEYDEKLALEIARSQNWGIWGFKEYWDVLRAVWELNQRVPRGQPKMRVIGIDRKMNAILFFKKEKGMLKDPDELAAFKKQLPLFEKRDQLMAEQIETEIISKGERGVVLVGNMHAFTHYRQPGGKDGKFVSEWARMGYILYEKHGEKIFQITLHLHYASPATVDPTYRGDKPVLTDLIEAIMERRGNVPVGFDVFASPLATIRDSGSYLFHYQPKVIFAEVCRGYIFLAPRKELGHCQWIKDFVSQEMFVDNKDFFEVRFNKKFSNADELNEFISAALGH